MNDRHSITDGSRVGPPSASTPGVVVFSSAGRLLHINEQALNIVKEAAGGESLPEGPIEASSLPSALIDLHREIVTRIEQRAEAGDWALFEVKRIVRLAGRKVTLRGFGVPDHRSPRQSRVIVTIQDAVEVYQPVVVQPLAPTGT